MMSGAPVRGDLGAGEPALGNLAEGPKYLPHCVSRWSLNGAIRVHEKFSVVSFVLPDRPHHRRRSRHDWWVWWMVRGWIR
jgi:hypothetical protein